MQRLRINLYPKLDTDGKTYFVGKMKSPVSFNFKNGMAFIFYPDGENPELHFTQIDNPDISDAYRYYTSRRLNPNRANHGNIPVELHVRWEKDPPEGQEPRKFFIGKIQFDGTLDASNGIIFFAFISDEDEEELQISVVDPNKEYQKKSPKSL